MKVTTGWQLWEIKRENKYYEKKIRFLKALIKHLKKEEKLTETEGRGASLGVRFCKEVK